MQNYFFIKTNGRYVKIIYQEICYIEGCRNYVRIKTTTGNHLALIRMKKLEYFLPVYLFCRIHKSFIVALDKMESFDSETVYLKNIQLPIGQQYKGELEKAVIIVSDKFNEFLPGNSFYTVPKVVNSNRSKFLEAG